MLIVSRRIGHQGDYCNRRYSDLGDAKAFLQDMQRHVGYVRQRDVSGYISVGCLFAEVVNGMMDRHAVILTTKRGWIGSC